MGAVVQLLVGVRVICCRPGQCCGAYVVEGGSIFFPLRNSHLIFNRTQMGKEPVVNSYGDVAD